MSSDEGQHGWIPFGETGPIVLPGGATLRGGRVSIAPIVAEHRRCVCTENGREPQCRRLATQEDFLCDPCREGTH